MNPLESNNLSFIATGPSSFILKWKSLCFKVSNSSSVTPVSKFKIFNLFMNLNSKSLSRSILLSPSLIRVPNRFSIIDVTELFVIDVPIKFRQVSFLHLFTSVITCLSFIFRWFRSNFSIFSVRLFTKNVLDLSER